MRIVDFLYGIPYMFLVVLVMLLFSDTARGQALPVFVALGLVQWLTMARIVRGQVLALRRADFVLAARATGAASRADPLPPPPAELPRARSWSTPRSRCRA